MGGAWRRLLSRRGCFPALLPTSDLEGPADLAPSRWPAPKWSILSRCCSALTSVVLDFGHRRRRQFTIQGFSVLDASPQKIRPRWNCDFRSHTLRQQPPKVGMMPAEIMTAAVAVLSDASPQPLDLIDQLFTGHSVQIFVHEFLKVLEHPESNAPELAMTRQRQRRPPHSPYRATAGCWYKPLRTRAVVSKQLGRHG